MAEETKKSLLSWHRIFGLMLTEHFKGTPFTVELEIDLSHHKQLLDVIVVRKHAGELLEPMPAGFEELADHNLISYKSFHEPLDDWALKELTGHYVNYRKQTSGRKALEPEEKYRLFAVCARTPRGLFTQVPPREVEPGVYDCLRGTDRIRVVVAGELPLAKKNALFHLFSASRDKVEYGRSHYQRKSNVTSTIVDAVLAQYTTEGIPMPYTMADFHRDLADLLTPAQRLANLTPQQRIIGLKPDELLAALSPQQMQVIQERLTMTKHSQPMKTKRKKK